MNTLKQLTYSFFTLLLSHSLHADNLTDVSEIISKANMASYYAADDGRAQARMLIVDSKGNKQIRQFTILRKDVEDEGSQDMLVFFSRPSDVKDTVFRVRKNVAQDDERWLYLPALDLVKRISAGDKRTSFVGAHFFYEDVSGRNPNEDTFKILSTDDSFYTIEATPKNKASVEFAYYIINIDKETFLPMNATYYDSAKNPLRQMEVLKTEVVQGFPTVTHSKITQLSDGSYTEMQFRGMKYDIGIPDSIFSERSLRTPPREWLD